jgi:hypothetical protein
MSGILPMILNSSGVTTPSNFFGVLQLGVTPQFQRSALIAVDSKGNVYVGGTLTTGEGFIAKYTSYGLLQWQFSISSPIYSMCSAPNDTIYLLGYYSSTAIVVMALNSSGGIQWQYQVSITTNYNSQYVIKADSSSNAYIAIGPNYYNTTYTQTDFLFKLTPSGSISWVVWYATSTNENIRYPTDLSIDTSGNLYICTPYYNSISAYTDLLIDKISSTGNPIWSVGVRNLIYGASNFDAGSIKTDSSGNVYVFSSVSGMILLKLNSSGTVQWQVSTTFYPYLYQSFTSSRLGIDNSNNLYCASNNNIVKVNSSGLVQWQKSISTNYQSAIVTDSNNMYSVGGDIGSTMPISFSSLPLDGTKTGSYTVGGSTVTYASITPTVTTPTFGVNTNTVAFVNGAPTPSVNTAFVTLTATTLSSSVTKI